MDFFWIFLIVREFFRRIFLEEIFGQNFLGEIFWEDFFWEDFFGKIILGGLLGGYFWEEFFVCIEIDLFVKILFFVKILSQWRRKEGGRTRI